MLWLTNEEEEEKLDIKSGAHFSPSSNPSKNVETKTTKAVHLEQEKKKSREI